MRPRYHFTPRSNWLSDPNGLVHDGSLWHLFYQYNPFGEDWGHMSWGHATSPDLASWSEAEPALLADEGQMVFSGSAVIDAAGSAGFGSNAMVAVFTAAARGEILNQAQALAYSTDKGATWTHHSANPVLDLAMADFRDPFVFWHEPSAAWIMVVVKSNEQTAQIYRSPDLKRWTLASEIGQGDAPGRVWECPTMVELPIIGTDALRWMFKVDALHDAPGAGALYLGGTFDGYVFTPEGGWQTVDAGRDFYAAIAWNGPRDARGRPAWIGWMGNHGYQHDFPKKGWRGVMSLPRRIGWVECGDGLRLSQEIEPSIDTLFSPAAPLGAGAGVPVGCRLTLESGFRDVLELSDRTGAAFTLAAGCDCWHLSRRDAALPFLDCETTLERRNGEGLSIWLDSETIEVLTSDGTGCASFQHRPSGDWMEVGTDQPERVSVAALL